DTCRICSAPAEPDQPLFHPCKCSGTIRYIHQDCLTTWLAHSKKKTCDVCKHPYKFTKVYDPNMPQRLPALLLIKRIIQQLVLTFLLGLRAFVVLCVWLGFVPYITVLSWRMLFGLGEVFSRWAGGQPVEERGIFHPSITAQTVTSRGVVAPGLILSLLTERSSADLARLLNHFATDPTWASLPSDIFTGQIIASLMVLTFLAVFLLREWITQNRPGAFEDEEELAEPERPAPPQPVPPQPAPLQLAPLQVAPLQFAPLQPAPAAVAPPVWPVPVQIPAPHAEQQAVVRAPIAEVPQASSTPRMSDMFFKPIDMRPEAFDIQRPFAAQLQPRYRPWPMPENAKFTFTSRLPESRTPITKKGESPFSVSPDLSSIIPPIPTQPSKTPADAHPSQSLARSDESASVDPQPPPSTYPSHTLPRIAELSRSRRPPMLPSTSLPPSPLDQPLASPSHATYTAPEELDADITHVPSTTKLQGYFDREEVHAGKRVERAEYFDHEEGSSTGLRRRDSARDMRTVAAMYPERDQREYDRYFAENTAVEESDEELMLGSDEDVQVAMDLADASDLRADTAGILRQPREPVQNARQADEDVPGLDPEDLDGNADDDMDGALEAIGLRGPLLGIFSNAALMTMFLDAATIVGVFTPFVIGKTAVLLTLNPPHLLRILHFPIRVMRIFTDPVVDSAAFFFMRVVLPLSFGFLKVSWGIVAPAFSEVVDVNYVAESIEHATTVMLIFSQYPNILRLAGYDQPTVVETVVEQTESSHLFSVAEHYFAVLGKAVRENTVSFRQTWVQLSLGTGPSERTFAVFVGYFVASVLVAVYLNILTVGNMLNASRAVRNSIRQQLLVLKVAMFILIELGLFPLGCGTVLDLCSLWFFPEASFLTRTTFFMHAPVTAMFYHWVAGTLFMYTFAALLSGCRNIMRPGAMWFIKDPQDQNSHPIRDILERPAVTQLRKILTSAFMYAFVVFCAVGSIAGLFLLGKKSIMPLRWKPREPLSNVPVDLMFLNLALPYTIRYFRPKKTIKLVSIFAWKQLSTRLRLTSYFFGGRYPDEEHSPRSWKHSVQRFVTGRCHEYTTTSDGSFRRVPASDQMALPRDMSATVVVTEFGQPLDEDGRKLIAEQDAEAVKARHMVKDDYAVVYFPPSLGYRVISFITILWALGVMALGVAFALPLVIGRTFFAMFIPYEVHDGYSFILGFYLLWTCFVASKAVDRLDKRRQRTGGDLPRGDLRVLVVKRGLLWATKISYMILFLGVIVPVLIGFVVDLYLILPVRMALDPTMIPRLRVIDSWALGLLYGKIAWLVMKHRRGAGISRGLQRIKNNGWTHPDPVYATKEVIVPLTVGLLGMILFPPLVLKTVLFVIPIVEMDDRFFFTHLYPVIFASAAICHAAMVMFDMVSAWSQTIRDKEFLVEMRLRNHESDKETEENPSTKGKQPQSNK
ncbi:hypothetical protein FISHEDRAFT_34386, partial [Fistulina hepatica ATCC 64428]